jgi:hypothetical protein
VFREGQLHTTADHKFACRKDRGNLHVYSQNVPSSGIRSEIASAGACADQPRNQQRQASALLSRSRRCRLWRHAEEGELKGKGGCMELSLSQSPDQSNGSATMDEKPAKEERKWMAGACPLIRRRPNTGCTAALKCPLYWLRSQMMPTHCGCNVVAN